MKVVINKCYGGYGLRDAAYEHLIELGVPVKGYIEEEIGKDNLYKRNPENEGKIIFDRDLEKSKTASLMRRFSRYWDTWTDTHDGRTDPLVIQVVEELGTKANGQHAELRVVEIPDGIEWEIDEYDGQESIAEKHRSWG